MDAYQEITLKARQKVQKGEVTSVEAGIDAVVQEDTALYQKYKDERARGVRHVAPQTGGTKAAPAEGPALRAILTRAAAVQRAFQENGAPMSVPAAITAVVNENPALYEQYKIERRRLLGG